MVVKTLPKSFAHCYLVNLTWISMCIYTEGPVVYLTWISMCVYTEGPVGQHLGQLSAESNNDYPWVLEMLIVKSEKGKEAFWDTEG